MAKHVSTDLFKDISNLIETARNHVAHYANSALVLLYWQIGNHINQQILKNDRAEYGEQVVKQLAAQLTLQYGSGFDTPNLTRMVRIAKLFPEATIVVTLSQQLTWSHFVKLISIDDSLKRDFYIELCRLERWSVRGLRQKIDSMRSGPDPGEKVSNLRFLQIILNSAAVSLHIKLKQFKCSIQCSDMPVRISSGTPCTLSLRNIRMFTMIWC